MGLGLAAAQRTRRRELAVAKGGCGGERWG